MSRFFAVLTLVAVAATALLWGSRRQPLPAPQPRVELSIVIDAGVADGASRVDAAQPVDAGRMRAALPPDAALPIAELLGHETDRLIAPMEVWQRQVTPLFMQWFTATDTDTVIGWLMDMCQENMIMIRSAGHDTSVSGDMFDAMRDSRRTVSARILALANGRITPHALAAVLTTDEYIEACANIARPDRDGGQ